MPESTRVRLAAYQLALLAAIAVPGSAQPTDAFRAWARTHASRISVDDRTTGTADLRPLAAIVGRARVVALTEPFHLGHEPLVARNRIIRHLVTEQGFTAVALETGLAQSRILYDYVLGRTPDADSVIRAGFTYGFGRLPENVALLKWMRAYNAARPAGRQVHLYGIDLPGQLTGAASAALVQVLDYLDRVDAALGARTRAEYATIVPRFDAPRFVTLPAAEQDLVTGKVHDLATLVRRGRIAFTAASSRDEYEWALRQAVNAEQDASFMRLIPAYLFDFLQQYAKGETPALAPDPRLIANGTVREMSMAENIAWALEREGARGRIVTFAHNTHQQRQPMEMDASTPLAALANGMPRAGNFAHAIFGRELVTIGTYFGRSTAADSGALARMPDRTTAEGLFAASGTPAYIADLRAIPAAGPLRDFLTRKHETRLEAAMHRLSPLAGYDAILYIERITPSALKR